MTRETLEKLPANIRTALERLKKDYKNEALQTDEVRKEIYGYTNALRDGGIITERQRQLLYCYCTL